jgi:zinc transporter ZupT
MPSKGMQKIKFSTMSTLICIFAMAENEIISLLAICVHEFSESFAIVLLSKRLSRFM